MKTLSVTQIKKGMSNTEPSFAYVCYSIGQAKGWVFSQFIPADKETAFPVKVTFEERGPDQVLAY